MESIRGRYGEAKVLAKTPEDNARAQIKEFCDQVYTEDAKIMPDAHAGTGCTIGTTMTITDAIVPNLIGVDIGCGVLGVMFKGKDLDLVKLDEVIRAYVSSGFSLRQKPHRSHGRVKIEDLKCFHKIRKTKAAPLALGTLGGGDHFMEIDRGEDGGLYFVIHSGGRNIALQVAHYYQNLAYENLGGKNHGVYSHGLAFLEGEHMEAFLADMRIMLRYAEVNQTDHEGRDFGTHGGGR
ncbi:MAG: RtcB family protein [Clostridia bacterium]|nr:RtcB family protein [Clostridia bacterium]